MHLTDRSVNDVPPPWIQAWQGDGIITRVASPEIRDAIKHKNIPVVDLNEQLGEFGVPQISNDHKAIGVMAADHLLARGFQQFEFLGHSGHTWSDVRGAAFAEKVRAEGFPCDMYVDRPVSVLGLKEGSWQVELDGIAAWVASLPKPVGIMAGADFRGVQMLTACRQANVAVPEQRR